VPFNVSQYSQVLEIQNALSRQCRPAATSQKRTSPQHFLSARPLRLKRQSRFHFIGKHYATCRYPSAHPDLHYFLFADDSGVEMWCHSAACPRRIATAILSESVAGLDSRNCSLPGQLKRERTTSCHKHKVRREDRERNADPHNRLIRMGVEVIAAARTVDHPYLRKLVRPQSCESSPKRDCVNLRPFGESLPGCRVAEGMS
jgi:hypothetical protein